MNHKKFLLARPPEVQSHSRNKVRAVKVRSTTTEVHIMEKESSHHPTRTGRDSGDFKGETRIFSTSKKRV